MVNFVTPKRVDWVDTAKGICIILVIIHHVCQFLNVSYPLLEVFKTFRMPLYFILSGLFFKTYGNIRHFLLKKINNLIVPYIFFYLTLSVCVPVILNALFGIKVWFFRDYGLDAIKFIFSEEIISNPSIWFLLCLFEVNLIFYIIFSISHICKKWHTILLTIFSLFVGFYGIALYLLKINFPFYIDSALSATPFFLFGWYLKNKTSYLYKSSLNIKYLFLSFCFFFTIIYFINGGACDIITNSYGSLIGILQLYPYGIIGSVLVFELSRYVGTVRIVSFIGRYSIIVLCIHSYIVQFCGTVMYSICSYPIVSLFFTTILTVLICFYMISPIKRILPYFTAQKNIFNV